MGLSVQPEGAMADLLHPNDVAEAELQEEPQDPGDFEVAGTAANALEADLLWRALEDAGIPAIVRSPRSDFAGKLDAPVDLFTLLVPVRDLPQARSLLTERRAALEADPDSAARAAEEEEADRKSTRLNSSHGYISYAVFCLKKKTTHDTTSPFINSRESNMTPPRSSCHGLAAVLSGSRSAGLRGRSVFNLERDLDLLLTPAA